MKGKRNRLKKLCLVCLLLSLFCLPVHADIAPKPSITVDLKGLEGRACWGTLLSAQESTGRFGVVDSLDHLEGYPTEEREAKEQFFRLGQENEEGLYFLNYMYDCSDGQFIWYFYPPSEFQLALWFPDTKTLLVSETEKRYAFDSYFTLSLEELTLTQGEQTGLSLSHSYPYGKELLAFLGRVALTVGIEVLAALPFGLWSRRQLKIILKTNVATQGCLNVGVNLFTYFGGALAGATIIFMTPIYLLAELVVVGQELITYRRLLVGQEGVTRRRVTAYTWTANALSFVIGYLLSFQVSVLF